MGRKPTPPVEDFQGDPNSPDGSGTTTSDRRPSGEDSVSARPGRRAPPRRRGQDSIVRVIVLETSVMSIIGELGLFFATFRGRRSNFFSEFNGRLLRVIDLLVLLVEVPIHDRLATYPGRIASFIGPSSADVGMSILAARPVIRFLLRCVR
jgi:hypothetical protein